MIKQELTQTASKKPKIVITGTSGLLGSHIALDLISRGYTVIGTHSKNRLSILGKNTDFLDLCSEKSIEIFLEKNKPDLVIHAAAMTDIDQAQTQKMLCRFANVRSTETIAEYCKKSNTKLIFISTPSVFGKSEISSKEIKINDDKKPINYYSECKKIAEGIVEKIPRHCIIRLNPFGHSPSSKHLLDWAISSSLNGDKVSGYIDSMFNPIFAGNVGKYVHEIIKKDFSGIVHLGCNNKISKFEFVKTTLRLHDIRKKVFVSKSAKIKGHSRLRNNFNVLSLKETSRSLDIKFQSFTEEYEDFLEFKKIGNYSKIRLVESLEEVQSKTWVVIPAKNESKTIEKVIASLVPYFNNIVVVDDGSSDNTASLANHSSDSVRVASTTVNSGYDSAIAAGFSYALAHKAGYVLTFDADGQHLVSDALEMLKNISDCDMVLGVRDTKPRVSEHAFSCVLYPLKISDPLCGMKLYRTKLLKHASFFDRFKSIGTDLVVHSLSSGYTHKEVKIRTEKRVDTSRFGRKLVANFKITNALLRVIRFHWRSVCKI